jgi:peptidoglycan/xylan/chitin deacetylase (PgdA/CDA1 family)
MTRIAVLTYHAIDRSGSVLSVAPEDFRAHVEMIARLGHPVISASRLAPAPSGEREPLEDGSFAFTFDDGYASVAEHAAPLLQAYGFPFTVFLVTSWVGKSNDWPSQPAWVLRAPLLGWDAIGRLAEAGAEIGAHTADHMPLPGALERVVREQIEASRAEIERRTGVAPRLFAYPGGRADDAARRIAGSRFAACFGTRHARAREEDDRAELPRIETFYFREARRFARLLSPAVDARLAARRALRRLRRLGESRE